MTPTRSTYAWTYGGLLLLSGLTFGLAFASLGAWAPVAALAIATAKAALIALFFMHLVEQRATNAFAFGVSVALLVLLVGLAAADVATREEGAPRVGAADWPAGQAPADGPARQAPPRPLQN